MTGDAFPCHVFYRVIGLEDGDFDGSYSPFQGFLVGIEEEIEPVAFDGVALVSRNTAAIAFDIEPGAHGYDMGVHCYDAAGQRVA